MIKGRSRQPAGAHDRRRYWRGLRGGRRKETSLPVTLRRCSILGLGHQRLMMPNPFHQQEVMTTV